MILIFRWSASSCDQTLLTNIPEPGELCQILTHNQQVLTGRHCLERLLGGDLAGVVTRHVRVDIRQHHATAVTSGFLQKRFDQITENLCPRNTYIEVKFWQNKKLFLIWIISRLISVELVRPFVPFHCLQTLTLQQLLINRIPVDEELTVSTAVPFVSDEPNAST